MNLLVHPVSPVFALIALKSQEICVKPDVRIHRRVVRARAPVDEIQFKINLTFRAKKLMLQICFNVISDLKLAPDPEYRTFLLLALKMSIF